MNKTVEVLTFNEFSAKRGVSNFASQHPELHRVPGGVSKPTAKAADRRLLRESQKWQDKRIELEIEYNALVAKGEIRPPTRIEKLRVIATGKGEAAEAAKRLLKNRR